MRIAFIHEQNAFLPELEAYRDFFSAKGVECLSMNASDAASSSPDVCWHFMGKSFKRTNAVTIHEYTSSSIPPFAKAKNLLKKTFNSKPDFRLFLNQYVHAQLSFHDEIPFGFRDMGVSLTETEMRKEEKKFDFVYIGELAKRNIEPLLQLFVNGNLSKYSILILSRNYSALQKKFHQNKNIHFQGPVKHSDVKNFLQRSRFALNLIPNEEPFNQQTSTKLLEYAAMKLPVISNEYAWIKNFQREYGGQFYFIDDSISNMNWESINAFNYSWPDLLSWDWGVQIRKSGVLQFLESKFPSLSLTSSEAFGRILQ